MQNDMRDRLVELMKQASIKCANTIQCDECVGYGKGAECGNYLFADYLIANGVIVPPCKVGDKLYGFEYPRKDIVVINEETVEELCFEIETDEGWYHIGEIGKRVFLTKDQAEQKLKEMRVENG